MFCSVELLGVHIQRSLPESLFCYLTLYFCYLSLSNLKTLWVKGDRKAPTTKVFRSAFQPHENRRSTEDAKDPIKTVFVHQQYGPSGSQRGAASNNVLQ